MVPSLKLTLTMVLLGTDTVEDHLKLAEEFLRTCDECHTKVKISKCEFMTESLQHMGLEVCW